jgi:hypothetical protein
MAVGDKLMTYGTELLPAIHFDFTRLCTRSTFDSYTGNSSGLEHRDFSPCAVGRGSEVACFSVHHDEFTRRST